MFIHPSRSPCSEYCPNVDVSPVPRHWTQSQASWQSGQGEETRWREEGRLDLVDWIIQLSAERGTSSSLVRGGGGVTLILSTRGSRPTHTHQLPPAAAFTFLIPRLGPSAQCLNPRWVWVVGWLGGWWLGPVSLQPRVRTRCCLPATNCVLGYRQHTTCTLANTCSDSWCIYLLRKCSNSN